MAIVDMQKISICASKKRRKEILELLQSMGVMEMREEDISDPDLEHMDTASQRAAFVKAADTLDGALNLLQKYAPEKKKGMSLFAERRVISSKTYAKGAASAGTALLAAKEITNFEKQIQEDNGNIRKDETAIASLTPWLSLDIPLDTASTEQTSVFIGTFPRTQEAADLYASVTADLKDPAPVDINVLAAADDLTYAVIICHNAVREAVESNLRQAGFARPSISSHGVPAQEKEGYEADIKHLEADITEAEQKIAAHGSEREAMQIASDAYRTRAEKYELLGRIPQSEHMFFLEGWVTKEHAEPLENLLTQKYGALVMKEERAPDEIEPTLLHNNKFATPAESVLESYGLPQHGRVDPTFIMSIFYVFFFGMMLSDAGYGILITIFCGVMLAKHKRMEEGITKMLQLFFWCGISTAFWGFMYGGFFGNAIDTIATTFFGYKGDTIVKPLWFEPMQNPMRLLVWCMLFGLIHLFTGLGIKGYEMLKSHDFVGFISDILAWYAFLLGLIFLLLPSELFASISGMTFSFPGWVHTAALAATFIGMGIILVMSGREHHNWAIRIALGAYDLYGVTSWLSDVLSYSRLLALGLATGVIANVINMMASMFGGGVLGAILFVIIFLLGHAMNIAINMLGAYVHTNRLQYVEFFGKFYDAGGKAFRPFATKFHYVEVKEEK